MLMVATDIKRKKGDDYYFDQTTGDEEDLKTRTAREKMWS
jgi:hypothetical protein